MAGQCPYLGLDEARRQTVALTSPRHRCYAEGQPERIGARHQSMTCLTTAFRRCPRLMAGAQVGAWARDGSEVLPQVKGQVPWPGDEQALQPVPSRPATPEQVSAGQIERAVPSRPAAPPTELRAARRTGRAVEFAVLGLVLAIVLALSFIGYAVFYRLRVGPGLASTLPVAQAVESSEVERSATLVPTYTPTPTSTPSPTPMPTLAAAAVVTKSPTPLPEPTLAVPTAPARPVADYPPTRLVIAKIGLDIPVVPVGVKMVEKSGRTAAMWADVPNAGGFHETSALPGQPGNTVINGHRDIQGSVFRHLDQVEVGDEIVLYVGDVEYPYRATETLVVPETFASAKQRAENLRLIGTVPEERLTLVTCTPVGLATHRLLVIAKPPELAGPDMPEAGFDPSP